MATLRVGRPVWLEGRAGRPRQVYDSLAGDCEVDLAIVGGGMTGSTIAALFAETGVRVAVAEGGLAGRGSTAASTALLLQEPDPGLTGLSERYGGAAARRIWERSRESAAELVRTIRRMRIACDLVRRDAVYYATRGPAAEALARELALRRRAGIGGRWLTPGGLRRLTGIPGRGAIVTRGNAQFDPYRASLGLLRHAAADGALVFERTPVRRIEQRRGGVRLVTPHGSIAARQVVVATGYAVPGFEPLVGRFGMRHTYVIATPPVTASEASEIGFGDVMAWDTERPYHYLRWTPDRRLLIGGADRPLLPGRRRAGALAAAVRELKDHFDRLLPALADIRVDRAWEGLFAAPPDGLPYIGRHRRYPRHLFALGYGGNGMTFGFLAARMLLDLWRGRDSPDHALFAFSRGRG